MPAVPQPVSAPLTRAAIFLVLSINPGGDNRATLRSFCGDLGALFRAVEFRDIEGALSCVMGIGSDAWTRLFGDPRPAELHPLREIRAGSRHAVATPGDIMFHIRAKRDARLRQTLPAALWDLSSLPLGAVSRSAQCVARRSALTRTLGSMGIWRGTAAA